MPPLGTGLADLARCWGVAFLLPLLRGGRGGKGGGKARGGECSAAPLSLLLGWESWWSRSALRPFFFVTWVTGGDGAGGPAFTPPPSAFSPSGIHHGAGLHGEGDAARMWE